MKNKKKKIINKRKPQKKRVKTKFGRNIIKIDRNFFFPEEEGELKLRGEM